MVPRKSLNIHGNFPLFFLVEKGSKSSSHKETLKGIAEKIFRTFIF